MRMSWLKVSASPFPKKRAVIRCRKAMEAGYEVLNRGAQMSLEFIRSLHRTLLEDTGENGGQWRDAQTSIGPDPNEGKVLYMPPAPSHIPALMENLEQFMTRNDLNPLVQAAVMYAQFVMIQPFGSMNGQIARMLIPLFLTRKTKLEGQCLVMSFNLRLNMNTYCEALCAISGKGNWEKWLEFFLEVLLESCKDSQFILKRMQECMQAFLRYGYYTMGVSGLPRIMLEYVLAHPLFTAQDMEKDLELKQPRQKVTHNLLHLKGSEFISMSDLNKGRAAVWKIMFLDLAEGLAGMKSW